MKRLYGLLLFAAFLLTAACSRPRATKRVLYYTTDSTSSHVTKLKEAGDKGGWEIITTSNESYLRDDSLATVSALFLPFSSVNELGHRSMTALKRYLEAGGGGVVTAADSALQQKEWPWIQTLNELEDGREGSEGNGRLIKLRNDYKSEDLIDGLNYAIGNNTLPDYSDAKTLNVPDSNRYTRTVLVQGLDEPLGMAILPDNHVLMVERKGGVKIFNSASKSLKTIANFNVFSGIEDGLLGVATHPDFRKNNWIYFYYAVGGDRAVNRLSRFELLKDSLVLSSEKVLLEIPTQRIYCCHSAGYLTFDARGNLYLSTGDNTNAEETEGYTPVDERPGRELADDQATAANTNDLRGKILRITPKDDGSYTIPDGNLFPKDGSKGKPEIYTMGSRNPYRFTVDRKNNYVYWGDVGPDTKVKGDFGEFMSFDEINQAKKPGFFGWPYFLGNNQAFPMWDYETKTEGPKKDPKKPINDSPNNTGEKELPPAQPAMIWYGKGNSRNFPLVGNGGASAMAGPVYYSDLFTKAPYKLSDYYSGKLIIYEWIRGWMMAVTFDENGDYQRMEPFLDHMNFDAPVDVQFSEDGALYVLEYGTNWFSKNTNAKLVRIEYVEGNRNPVAEITMDKQYGGSPLTVEFSAKNSVDHDAADKLSYTWKIGDKEIKGEKVKHTFTRTGAHEVTLTVVDDKNGKGTSSTQVFVGNTPPEIHINTNANRTFYWDNTVLDYVVKVEDQEETAIDPARVKVSFGFVPQGKDVAVILAGNQDVGNFKYLKGQQMIASLDCKSCHSLDKESVGPTYLAVAERYSAKPGAVKQLSAKIIQGGSGSWGERAMTPHPALSTNDANEIVNYILSLSAEKKKRPLKDAIALKEHIGKGIDGSYLLNATYLDKGANGIEALQGRDFITLRNPTVQADDFDEGNVRIATITTEFYAYATSIHHDSYIRFNNIDLTHINKLKFRAKGLNGGTIEVRLAKKDGPLLSTVPVPAGDADWKEIIAPIRESKGAAPLYFVFKGKEGQQQNLLNLDWIYFSRK